MSGADPGVEQEAAPRTGWRRLLSMNTLSLVLVLGACCLSLFQVLSIRHAMQDPDTTIIRLSHWQLESGYREALQAVIEDYQKLHADQHIKIVQMGITEKVYGQWLNVNLIANNAPDIAEMGQSKLVDNAQSVAKYFLPLGREISKPNPYNNLANLDELEKSTPQLIDQLQHAPWRETLVDGMRGGWRQDLQDYYNIPTSFFTVRMFYNKPLFKEVLGSDEPPKSLGELFDACQKLRDWHKAKGLKFDPLAGTSYHRGMFINTYRIPFTYGYEQAADVDLSCDVTSQESWIAFENGKAKFSDPAIAAYFAVARRMCEQFNPNFGAMDRDQALAAFAQGRAAMMASGSWDAASIFGACKFPVGIVNFPMPAPGEQYSEFARYGANEASVAGGSGYGVTKNSKHPEIALDFLRFLTSHKYNQKYNRLNGWLPVTIGTTPAERMKPFMPNPYGVLAHLDFSNGYDLETRLSGKMDLFFGGEKDYPTLCAMADEIFKDKRVGFDRIWYKSREKEIDNARSLERTLAVLTSRDLYRTGGDAESAARARETTLDQALTNQGTNIRVLHDRQVGGTFPEAP